MWYYALAFCLGFVTCWFVTAASIKAIKLKAFIDGANALKKELESQIKQHNKE